MKIRKITSHLVSPKGVRMRWQALDEVKPVKLSRELTTGKFLSEGELKRRNNNSTQISVLVP